MKKLILSCLMAAGFVSAFAQQVNLSPAAPEAGKPLSLEYNPAGGKLDKLANVKCTAYTFINMKQKVLQIPLTKDGTTYKGTFTPADSTSIAVFVFSADGTKDDNPKGYYTLFYSKGEPTAMAYYWEAQLYSGMGKAYAGIDSDKDKTLAAYEKAFRKDPKLKTEQLVPYMSAQLSKDKTAATAMIRKEIAAINANKAAGEADFTRMVALYKLMKSKASIDSATTVVMKKYPTGPFAFSTRLSEVYAEKEVAKKEELANAILKDFKYNPDSKEDANKFSNLFYTLASAYSAAENNGKFEFYSEKVSALNMRASLYNSYAWAGAENKKNLEFSAKISKKSLEIIQSLKNDEVPSYYNSKEEYLADMDDTYATYADTYALLMDHLGRNAEALKYQEQAVTINKFSNPEMNERYVSFLRKNGKNDLVISNAEKFIKDGFVSEKMKEDLKAAYKGATPFEQYYAGLEKIALQKEREKWMKEMINMPAPKFSLVNLKGETVSLERLKGKVVIVDYWATWCGPCVASFPGMQKAVDKYKNDPNVVFLFVNTWQTEDNREQVVKEFMASTKYTFNVLLDTRNKQDPGKFDVISQYNVDGIPTKFIIDGNGNIRFKKVGFSGSADGTVKELDMMIEMARNANNTR